MSLNLAGVLLMAASETEDSDILWCINHDSFPFKKPLMETQVCAFFFPSNNITFSSEQPIHTLQSHFARLWIN